MRHAFVAALKDLAASDERIFLLTADIGFMVLEEFRDSFPQRFLNVGVAEQNMIGVASGLARSGFIPFAYTIATFASMRAYEFIRNGPLAHRLPVRIVAVGGGFEYGPAGHTHHALEDLAIMRAQPGLEVYAPADGPQAASILRATALHPGPIYYRLGKNDQTRLANLDGEFVPGQLQLLKPGKKTLVIASGAIADEAQKAVTALHDLGQPAAFAILSTLSPVDQASIRSVLQNYSQVITVEEHYVVGGLGSLIAEIIAEGGVPCRLIRAGIREVPGPLLGSQAYLRKQSALDIASLVELGQTLDRYVNDDR